MSDESGQTGQSQRGAPDRSTAGDNRPPSQWWGRDAVVLLLTAVVAVPLVYVPTYYGAVVGKAVLFRVLVEAAFALWIGGIALRRFRIRLRSLVDPAGLALAAFTIWGTVASLFGFGPLHSLFGEITRMWGAMTWWHLLAFYTLVRTTFTESEWRRFFGLALAVSVLVVAIGLARRTAWGASLGLPQIAARDELLAGRMSGLLGNSGYMAAYLLMGTGAGAWLLTRVRRLPSRFLASVGLLVCLSGLALTSQRAALGGLILGAAVAGISYAVFTGPRPRRLAVLSGIVLIVSAGVYARANPQTAWVQSVPGLRRVANMSVSIETIRDRAIAWQAAGETVRERPWTGAGFENFKVVFDQNFDPTWYRFAGDQPWDRPHNAFVGAFVSGGVPAGLAYLAVFLAIIWSIWRAAREGELTAGQAAVLLGATVAYCVHLFFWFEDVNSTPLFLGLAAYAGWGLRPVAEGGAEDAEASGRRKLAGLGVMAVCAAGVAAVTWLHHAEYVRAAREVRLAHDAGPMRDGVEHFERAVAHRPPGDDEVPEEYARLMGRPPRDVLQRLRQADRIPSHVRRGLEGSFSSLSDAIEENPRDSRLLMHRASVYLTTSLILSDTAYYRSAGEDINRAIELAPKRITYYQVLSDWYLFGQRPELALRTMQAAAERYSGLPETQFHLAKTYLAVGRPSRAFDHLLRAARGGHLLRPAFVARNIIDDHPQPDAAAEKICAAIGEGATDYDFCLP